jgi:hypothetical protein
MRHVGFTLAGLLALSLGCGGVASAQSADLPPVDDLKAPPSPAFVLLDISPSKVERPQAVRPLVVSALSAVSSEGFPRNYAVEFAPYWLGTPQLSFSDYYGSSVGKATVRHLSLSVATTPLGNSPDAGTALGFGLRTLPVPGRPHPKLEFLQRELTRLQLETIGEEGFFSSRLRLITLLQEGQKTAGQMTEGDLSSKPIDDLIDQMIGLDIEIRKKQIEIGDPDTPKEKLEPLKAELADLRKQRAALGPAMVKVVNESGIAQNLAVEKQFEILVARYDQAQRAREAKRAADLKKTALAIQELDAQRVGPLLAVASAFAWDVPTGQTELTTLAKVGFWATPGYRIVRCSGEGAAQECSTAIDLLGVVRYVDNRRAGGGGETWEGGARFIWQARTKLAVSAEWLGRSGDGDPGKRLVGVAEYAVNDSTFLYASFGRDFEEGGVRRNLVSTIGLTFGLGKRPIIER